jgi:hypothetical protein
MHVILKTVPNLSDWQAAITQAGFDMTLDSGVDTARNTGFVPVRFGEFESGFEFSTASLDDSVPDYSANPNDPRKLSANFVWGGDLMEMCCALAAASALTKLTGGLLFMPEDGSQYSGDEAIQVAKAQIAEVMED